MKYGLIGEKLGHSFSKEIHAKIGNYDYALREIEKENLKTFIKERDFLGINVTIPYKETVIQYLDEVDESAKKIGAVNTVVNKNGKLYGYNTDYFGAKACLIQGKIDVKGKKVLILGTGGTSKTLSCVVADMGAKEILFVSRNKREGVISYNEAYDKHKDAEIIINTTPVGMYPHTDEKPIDVSNFARLEGAMDVIYNPISTNFILSAKERKINACAGLFMLVAQAVKAAELFGQIDYTDESVCKIYNEIRNEKRNIVFIGMPTCGKSTIGKRISKLTNKDFYDIDCEIQKTTSFSPSEIIKTRGETEFRKIEKEVVKKVSKNNGCVIATGGGAICDRDNVKNLKQNGIIIFLDRALSKLVPADDRPLSADKKSLEKLYFDRYKKYVSSADVIVNADGEIEDITELIMEILK